MKYIWTFIFYTIIGTYAQNISVPEETNNRTTVLQLLPPCPDGYECFPELWCRNVLQLNSTEKMKYSRKCVFNSDVCCQRSQPQPIESNVTNNLTILSRKSSDKVQCGIRKITAAETSARLSNSDDSVTRFAEFPWMVAVLLKNYTEPNVELIIYQAGGSIIHPSVVLTAAHRVSGYATNILKIRAGEWDISAKNSQLPYQERDIAQVFIHGEFESGSLKNDIALLFLVGQLEFADNVKPICLPPPDSNFDNRRCFATGWGKDVYGITGKQSAILKKVDLPIVPLSECETLLRETRLSKYFELHDSFVCAGGEPGKDSCNGDGGSPLVCPIQNSGKQYYQVGVVAWGIGCGDNNIPAVYTNIAKFRKWIDELLIGMGLTTDSYTT